MVTLLVVVVVVKFNNIRTSLPLDIGPSNRIDTSVIRLFIAVVTVVKSYCSGIQNNGCIQKGSKQRSTAV